MKTTHKLFFGSMLFLSCSLFAQDKVKMDVARPEPTKEEKAWTEYMSPGPMHQLLIRSNGDWNQEITFWMAPGAPETKTVSKCFNSMILGDRYQVSVSTGEMMGMPFEGRSTVGYDNSKKVFQSTWIDNMGTGIMYMEGPYDAATKTVSMKGEMVDPMSGKIERARQTMKFIDDNNQLMEMYVTKDGKEFKNMVIKFTRR